MAGDLGEWVPWVPRGIPNKDCEKQVIELPNFKCKRTKFDLPTLPIISKQYQNYIILPTCSC